MPPSGDQPPPRPRSADPAALGFTPRPRVRWLAPGMLARTGVQVALSRLFGTFLDRRELLATEPANPLDLSGNDPDDPNGPNGPDDPNDPNGPDDPNGPAGPGDGTFWLDYVADVGDGFDATTTVASQIAADELELGDGVGGTHHTRAGALLVMGGDQCYPVASPENYADRLVGPYRMMLPWTDRPRTLVALPGNHDWYDGLTSFLRQFCQNRWIGGWRTVQSRSYFAVKLPHGWWLWGIDIQLGTDIDEPQLSYFRRIAEQLEPDDAIILCWAMPAWVESGPDNPEGYAPLEYFERTVIPDRRMLRVSLSGDYHHYARYYGADDGGQHKITAGGGGAYLFGTHRLPESVRLPPAESADVNKRAPVTYRLQKSYPDRDTSRRLRRGVLASIFRNPRFWLVPALVYLLLGVTLRRAFPYLARERWWVASIPDLVLVIILVAALWLGLAAFTGLSRRQNPVRRQVVSGLHTLVHLVVLVLTVVGAELATSALGWDSLQRGASVPVLAGLVGGSVGTLLVAVYLLLADRVGPNGVNTGELFSAQAIQDFKCFLRLRIDADGVLTVFPVKIERALRWEFLPADEAGRDRRWFRPADGREPAPELIEQPIVVPRRPTGRDQVAPGDAVHHLP